MTRLLWLITLLLLTPPSAAAAARELQGQILLVGEQGETVPAVNVDVTLRETGHSVSTLAQGLFRLPLPDLLRAGDRVALLVDKPDWVIQYPLEGEVRIPADLVRDTVVVHLLPKGSKRLWTDDRIERFIEDMMAKAREEVRPEGRPQDIDLSRYIKDWATRYGFGLAEAEREIERWVAEVERH
jgi:hypothetical protein